MRFVQTIVFEILIRPLVLIGIGLNLRNRERLPSSGPAIVVANHNSHLDTMVLMTLFGRRTLSRVRPVAAADYFLATPFRRWFSTKVMNIIPVDRETKPSGGHPLDPISEAINAGDIVVLFPEGTRGEPEERVEFKTGIAHLAKRHTDVLTIPIYLHGLGKALPRGEAIFVPFFCDVFVGLGKSWSGNRADFMSQLDAEMSQLESRLETPEWT